MGRPAQGWAEPELRPPPFVEKFARLGLECARFLGGWRFLQAWNGGPRPGAGFFDANWQFDPALGVP